MELLNKIVRSGLSYFHPEYLPSLVYLLEKSGYRAGAYLKRFWTTQDYEAVLSKRAEPTTRAKALLLFITVGALLQAVLGIIVMALGLWRNIAGGLQIGLALIVSYPLIWAHMLALAQLVYQIIWALFHPKAYGRDIVCRILEGQVVRLRAAHSFTLIAVAGSIGKTSVKLAIAHTIEPTRRVIYQTGNYNDRTTVPLVLFGQKLPNLFNVVAWLSIFAANERTIRRPNFYDVAVLEIGTDHPGQMADFAYLKPDITVVTAITAEHMEHFKNLDGVAKEELIVCDYSKKVLINADDTPAKYISKRKVSTYGTRSASLDYSAKITKPHGLTGSDVRLTLQSETIDTVAQILGEQGVKILLAAAAAAKLAGLSNSDIETGLKEVKPFSGRMQILPGIKGSTLIDDTYNATPIPVMAALDVLYAAKATQRIAIIGSMNELGSYAEEAHVTVGAYCDPKKLDLLITIGKDAEAWLAPAARIHGCEVVITHSPYDAGEVAASRIKAGAVVLAKGSQNKVFAEEALKPLLATTSDTKKLVRQSASWIAVKRSQFHK